MGLGGYCYHGDLAIFASQKGVLEVIEIFKFVEVKQNRRERERERELKRREKGQNEERNLWHIKHLNPNLTRHSHPKIFEFF